MTVIEQNIGIKYLDVMTHVSPECVTLLRTSNLINTWHREIHYHVDLGNRNDTRFALQSIFTLT